MKKLISIGVKFLFKNEKTMKNSKIGTANQEQSVARLINAPTAVPIRGNGPQLLAWLAEHPLPPSMQQSAAEIDASIQEARDAWE
jgi:hypothetical protein